MKRILDQFAAQVLKNQARCGGRTLSEEFSAVLPGVGRFTIRFEAEETV